MSVTDCAKCLRLWRDYVEATQLELSLWEQMPALQRDIGKVQELECEIDAAATERQRAWEVIRSHAASEHAGRLRDG